MYLSRLLFLSNLICFVLPHPLCLFHQDYDIAMVSVARFDAAFATAASSD
jgi:hypothetical protein